MTSNRTCRLCGAPLEHVFVDLGMSPLCESYIPTEKADEMEPFYPLCVYVCGECLLVQLPPHVSGEHIFSEYAYFSSYSDSWLEHARRYCEVVSARFGIDKSKHVVEVASNDGYLLRNFVERGIPAVGVEPAANVAKVAEEQGVPTRVAFFGEAYAKELVAEGLAADLVVGNNVLAQVPDLNSFVSGIRIVLKPAGVVTLEFPHLMRQIVENQRNSPAGGQLGRPSGARFRTYERLKNFAATQRGTLFEAEYEARGLYKAVDEIYRYPLRQTAVDTLNRQMKAGIKEEGLAELVIGLREDDRLCIISDGESDFQEPRIICSLGLSQDDT